MSKMRAKLKISDIEPSGDTETLSFHAVSASSYGEDGLDENNTFARFTPWANLKMTINNPDLVGSFKVGQEFYVDFTLAE